MKNIRVNTNIENLLKEENEAYYWVGLLLTDGSIEHKNKRIILQLQEKDKEQIYKFCNYINCKKIQKYKAKPFKFGNTIHPNIKTQDSYRIQCQDKESVSQLIKKFDFKPNKTYNPPKINLEKMPKNLFLSFLFGIISGDGNISYNGSNTCFSIEISCHKSWKNFLKQIKNKIENMGYNCQKLQLNYRKDMYRIRITNKKFCQESSNFIKSNQLPILKRKWNKIIKNL